MSLQNLANQMQATGRGGDTMLVHMNPKEVAGLQQLAMAHGGSLTINPQTGLPEAGFLSSILPTILGAGLMMIPGMQPLGAAAITGAGTGLMTGSLKKGLLAGLGAFGGANMAPGIMSAGSTTAAAAPTMTSVVPPTAAVPNPGGAALGSGLTNSAPNLAISPVTGQPIAGTNLLGAPTAAPVATGSGVAFPPNPVRPDSIVATSGGQGAPSVMQQFGSGLKNIFTNQGGAGSAFLGDNKMNLVSSIGSALMTPQDVEEEKKKKEAELERYIYAPRFAPSSRAANSTAERTYLAADGGMVPSPMALRDSSIQGTVEQMSQMNAMGDNTRYPMAGQSMPSYSAPAERPISQNVVYPATDEPVGAYTGMPPTNMAGGGITSLPVKKFAAAGAVKLTPAQQEKADKLAEFNKFKADTTKALNDYKKEYDLAGKQKAFDAETTALRKTVPANELAAWNTQRAKDKTALSTTYNTQVADYNKKITDRQKEYNAYNTYLTSYDTNKYAGISDLGKASDLTTLGKNYDTEIGKQKTDVTNAGKVLTAAKATGIQSLIDRAQADYDAQNKEYTDVMSGKTDAIKQFGTDYARTGTGVTARGQYSTTTSDVDEIKKQIADIKKNPAQTGGPYGSAQLSAAQLSQIKDLESKLAGMSAAEKTYNPATGQYEVKQEEKFKKLTAAPTYDSATARIMEEKDVRQMFEDVAGRSPTAQELSTYTGKKISDQSLFNSVNALAELGAARQFTKDDLNAQAKYYWGRDMTGGELAYYSNPANKITNFKTLRTAMTSAPAYLQNLNAINEATFNEKQAAAQVAAQKPASSKDIVSIYNDILGRPATKDEVKALQKDKKTLAQITADLEGSDEYLDYITKPFVPTVDKKDVNTTGVTQPGDLTINKPIVEPISQAQINAYRQDYNAPSAGLGAYQGPSSQLFDTTGQGGYVFNPPQQVASIEGSLPYMDVMKRLGINNVYKQIADKALPLENTLSFGAPKDYDPFGSGDPFGSYAAGGMAGGGEYHLGDYSDGGRLLKGPGDGVSDSIPAQIGNRQPARLADGEFVIPARIVSELGNGSTEAGARQLYAMMDRVQKKRRSTVGKGKIAVNSKAHQVLPA